MHRHKYQVKQKRIISASYTRKYLYVKGDFTHTIFIYLYALKKAEKKRQRATVNFENGIENRLI
ncbi:hypothetical protein HA44_13835 [Mixta gaviniae]|nr:hypothetical protein HA44_13835 [Mixta gaviniae]